MSVAQLNQKGQILVPKHLRRKLGLKPGGKLHLAEEEGRLVLTPVPPDPIQAATGFLKGKFSLTNDLRREHRDEARRGAKNSFSIALPWSVSIIGSPVGKLFSALFTTKKKLAAARF